MRRTVAILLAVLFASLATATVRAQQFAPDPEMVQQLQQFGQQMLQNMQAKGIDPQEYFQGMAQKIQDGTYDPQDIQQEMIDKGIVTNDMMTQMQGTMQKLALSAIRQQLASTDEEWAVLLPKLQTVVGLLSDVSQGGGLGSAAMMSGAGVMAGAQATNTPAAKAYRELRTLLKDKNATDQQVAIKLREWRQLHQKAKSLLTMARKDLISILTVRQEAILLSAGILE